MCALVGAYDVDWPRRFEAERVVLVRVLADAGIDLQPDAARLSPEALAARRSE